MRLVQVLGPGCPRCEKFKQNAETAVRELGIDATVEKVTDMDVITTFQVMATPALVVDGEVKAVGRVLEPEDIKKLLAQGGGRNDPA